MLSFLVSPLGRYVALAAVALTLAGSLYLKGRSDANANCRAAALQAALATAQADLANAQRAAQRDRDAAERLTAEQENANARLADYERALQSVADCTLSPLDVERLRGLGGAR